MRVLVCGCGSIGLRHARALKDLLRCDVTAYDPDAVRADRAAHELGVPSTTSESSAFSSSYELVVVAGPTATHVSTAREAVENGAHVFIEKPISHNLDGVAELLDEADAKNLFVGVGSNMRFHVGPSLLRRYLPRIGTVYYSRASVGYYLPHMRPGVDYRKLYAAGGEQGGCILDDIHEIDYHIWLFGPVVGVACRAANLSALEMEAEDFAHISLRFSSGSVAEITMDYLNQCRSRSCEIVGERGTLVWEERGKPSACKISEYEGRTRKWKVLYQSEEDAADVCYVEELAELLNVIAGGPRRTLADGREGFYALRVARAAKQAAEHQSAVEIA